MQLRKASRRAVKLRIGFSGTSGSGKTLSALRCAYGMIGDWDKIAVIDTENGSAELYADRTFTDENGANPFYIGNFQYLGINTFTPENYIDAIKTCEKAGIELIIIDSISHEWETVLAIHAAIGGKNSYTDWNHVTPRHDKFKNKILQSPCHIFTTVRRKQEYEITKLDGKTQINKVGTKEITRDNWEYELTTNFTIETPSNKATTSKDRTSLFKQLPPFVITEETGKQLLDWANTGVSDTEELLQIALVDINNASHTGDLNQVYLKFKELHETPDFLTALKEKKASFVATPVA